MNTKTGGIILAAGASARMLRPKALLPWGRSTFVQSIVEVFSQAQLSPIVIVIRDDATGAEISAIIKDTAQIAINPEPERGMLSSLQVGAQALLSQGITQALVTPVDQPQITQRICEDLLKALLQKRWAIAAHEGRWGHPYAALDLREILREERSAQSLLQRSDPLLIEAGASSLLNMNTPNEYQEALSFFDKETPNE